MHSDPSIKDDMEVYETKTMGGSSVVGLGSCFVFTARKKM